MPLSPPRPIDDACEVAAFDSGVALLDEWLKRRARGNHTSGASRTYVVCDHTTVVAYYALASGAVELDAATGRFRRNMPDPIPVAVLGRLAIAQSYQRQGVGRALMSDAARRVIQAADIIGIRGIVVYALSPEAMAFYVALGFEPSILRPMTLMTTLADLRAALA